MSCDQVTKRFGGKIRERLIKQALSKILEFLVGHERRQGNNSVHRSYCICGALKPEVERREHEVSTKTKSSP